MPLRRVIVHPSYSESAHLAVTRGPDGPLSPPLTQIRVLELASYFAGPSAGMYLADFGADVVKVELPQGDPGRTFPPLLYGTGISRAFLAANRGKRSAAIDWRTERGQEAVHRLLERTDVLIVDRPFGAAREAWPFHYEFGSAHNGQLKVRYPRLICATASPFGRKGPYAELPGYAPLVEAVSGVLHSSRTRAGNPVPLGFRLADSSTGMLLAHGIMMALLARRRTGLGQRVETSMQQALVAQQSVNLVWAEHDPTPPADPFLAGVGCYQCSDGRYITASSHQDRQWEALCRVLGLDHLLEDPEFKSRAARRQRSAELYPLLEGIFSTRPSTEWLPLLREAKVPCGPVLSRAESFDAPQVLANRLPVMVSAPGVPAAQVMGAPVTLSETPPAPGARVPGLGEHTREVLEEAGFTATEIDQLCCP